MHIYECNAGLEGGNTNAITHYINEHFTPLKNTIYDVTK